MSEVGNTVQKHGQLPLELRISFLEKEDGDDDPPQGWKRAGQWGQVSESESRTDDPSRATPTRLRSRLVQLAQGGTQHIGSPV